MQNRRICQCRPLLVMKVLHTLQQGQGEARPIQYYNNFVGYIYIYIYIYAYGSAGKASPTARTKS